MNRSTLTAPSIRYLGRSWYRRGIEYRCRRVFLSVFFVSVFLMVGFITAAAFAGACEVRSATVRHGLQGVMIAAVTWGLWYGYLVLRVNTSKKRELQQTADDQRRSALVEAIDNAVDRRRGSVLTFLLYGPLFLLLPAMALGVSAALALGSFQRYFSVDEFEAVQDYKQNPTGLP